MRVFGKPIASMVAIAAIMLPLGTIAQEAQDFADKLIATIKYFSTFDVEFGSAVSQGNNIILSDWNIPAAGSSRLQKILDGSVTFVGVEPTASGGYTAEQAIFSDIDFSDDGVRIEVRNVLVNDIEIFADPGENILNSMLFYQGIQIGPVNFSLGEREVFRIDEISSSFVPNEAREEFSGGYSISGIYGDLSQIEDSDLQEALDMFKLTELNATLKGDMLWTTKDGQLSIIDSTIDIGNIGQLVVNLDVLGYTLELAKSLQEQGRAVQAMDTSSSEAEMAGLQILMSMAAQLSLGELSIRFNDDSMTNNLLDFMAEDQGVSRKGFVSMATSVLPSVLTPLGLPALQEQIITAVEAYLVAPGNIEIMASPAEPVPFMALLAVTQNPSIAGDLLNISVTANQ